MDSIILEEDIDEDYEPTQAEIDEYAAWLGMKRPDDDDLLWIANEGLKAPLPDHWKPCKTQDGEIYYFNFQNGESVWDHPCDDYYRKTYEEEKTKKLRRQVEAQQPKRAQQAGAAGAGKGAASAQGLGRQPSGGPVGIASLGPSKLGPIGAGGALAPIGSNPPSLNASLTASGRPAPIDEGAQVVSAPAKKASGKSAAGAAAPAASASSELGDRDVSELTSRAREARVRLVELAAMVEGELEQECQPLLHLCITALLHCSTTLLHCYTNTLLY